MPLRETRTVGGSLIFDDGEILTTDATIGETRVEEARIARHPRSQDRATTDNTRQLPSVINVRLVFTDAPVTFVDQEPPANRAETLYARLLRAKQEAQTFTWLGVRPRANMQIARLEEPITPATGGQVIISARLEEVQFARAGRGAIPDRLLNPKRRAKLSTTKSQGQQSGTRAQDAGARPSKAKGALDALVRKGVINLKTNTINPGSLL